MRLIRLLFLISLISNTIYSQQFLTGHTSITLIDSSRNNRSIPTEIYYPADIAGDEVPVTSVNSDKFPVIAFGHGFVMTWEAYQNIWDSLAANGFIIAFPRTEGGINPSHDEFGMDLSFVISQLSVIGSDSLSLFFNRIDTMNCVMGHSMGGGAAFLAAEFNNGIKSLAVLAPAETNPSAIQAASSLNIPAFIIAGGNDCVTPPSVNQIPMYDSLQSACKTYISINGGSHCQMANTNFLCNLGEATCSPAPAITRSEQHIVINRYLIRWLNYQLKNDCQNGFDSLIVADTAITFQRSCLLCTNVSIKEEKIYSVPVIFPNPFDDELNIDNYYVQGKSLLIQIFTMQGKSIYEKRFQNFTSGQNYKLKFNETLNAGVYIIKISDEANSYCKKIIRR